VETANSESGDMSIQFRKIIASVPICLLLGPSLAAHAQQAAPPVASNEAENRAAILDSECWRRAMFELNEWFRSQTIYTPDEVAQMRADFNAQVENMSAKELQEVIADMEAKFKILDSAEVQEVRAWFARYISLLADWRREELLREIPNFATMTASQLNQEIIRLQRRKTSRANFNRNRQTRVNTQAQANRAPQAAAPRRTAQRPSYRSPYRPASRERPHENARVGTRGSLTVDPMGGIWRNLSF
jgi:hypothetical protein